tara:strand:+ start:7440 stop:7655 length:216 start_codon:yes stop_codon:yes gene_type:complete
MNRIFFSSSAIWVRVAYAMLADALSNTSIHAIVKRPLAHMMLGRVMYWTRLSVTFRSIVSIEPSPIFFLVF